MALKSCTRLVCQIQGGVTSEGEYHLALQAPGALIQQGVDDHMLNLMYTLRVSAAQSQNCPGGRNAILKITQPMALSS